MPIVKTPVSAPGIIKPAVPRIEDVKAKSTIVDTKYNPLSSLITFVEGSSYVVNYYSQVLNTDTALSGQDPGQSALYQQYKKINRLEIKIESPLMSDQDDETKNFTVKGSAHIHSQIIPNTGDMFAADVGDGREGVFQINRSEKRGIFKEAVYFVEFILLYFSEVEPARRADLESKVVQELHYIHDFIRHGQNPLISTTQFNNLEELKYRFGQMVDNYFRWFFSKEYSTIILPGQTSVIYDSYITTVLRSILSTRDAEKLKFMRQPNVEDDVCLPMPQLWRAMLSRDLELLKICNKKMGLASTKNFGQDPMMESIRYGGINYIVYPKVINPPIDQGKNNLVKPLMPIELKVVPTDGGSLTDLITTETIELVGTPTKLIHSVLCDDYYVLSEALYEDIAGKSVLEVLCQNYLQRESNDSSHVLKLVNSYTRWGGLEKFYYLPLLMILVKDIIKDM